MRAFLRELIILAWGMIIIAGGIIIPLDRRINSENKLYRRKSLERPIYLKSLNVFDLFICQRGQGIVINQCHHSSDSSLMISHMIWVTTSIFLPISLRPLVFMRPLA